MAEPGAGRAQAGAYPGHAFGGAELLVEGMGLAEPDHCLALIALIEEAFKREAEVDARHIKVEVSDHTVKLYGHVHSLKEANAATAAAAAAPGIAKVESHLVVSP